MTILRVRPVCSASLYNPFNKTHKFAIKRLENLKGKKKQTTFLMPVEQNSKHKNADCKSSQEKIWHRKILWSENADIKFNASNEEGDDSNKQ